MDIEEEKQGSLMIVSPIGRVDGVGAPDLEKRFSDIAERGEFQLLVDCARMDYISSAGLRTLLIGARQCQQNGGGAERVRVAAGVSGRSWRSAASSRSSNPTTPATTPSRRRPTPTGADVVLALVEEIVLLMLDDEGSVLPVRETTMEYVVAGAVLMDLAFANRIDTDPEKLVVLDPQPTGNDLLDASLARIAASEETRSVAHWVETVARHDAKGVREAALESLIARGILERRDERFLWVFESRRYPVIRRTRGTGGRNCASPASSFPTISPTRAMSR